MVRILNKLFMELANLPMPGHKWRPIFVRLGGVKVEDPKSTFIGRGVVFDGVHPEWIRIERGVRITANSIVLSHFINPDTGCHDKGGVIIQENVFVGAGSIITKPVIIGHDSIIGAGSVVTKSIPENEVWAGNPARFIKKRKV